MSDNPTKPSLSFTVQLQKDEQTLDAAETKPVKSTERLQEFYNRHLTSP